MRDKDKEVNQATRDSDDALLERFKLCSGKVHLADDETLDIVGVRDVVHKTYFGTSWTLKDVRYIPGLKRRLILVGQLDEEGYQVGFGDQQWKVTKGSLVVAHKNKCRSLYMVEDWYEHVSFQSNVPDVRMVDIYFCKPGGLGKQRKLSVMMLEKTRKLPRLELVHTEGYVPTFNQSEDPATMILLSKTAAGVVVETPLQFGVAERLSRTFRAESTGLRAEALKMLWEDSVSSGSNEMRYSFRDMKSHQVIRSRDITFVDSIYGARWMNGYGGCEGGGRWKIEALLLGGATANNNHGNTAWITEGYNLPTSPETQMFRSLSTIVIMEYLVNISKRRAFWSLNEDILKIYYSDYQYAVSIKEDTAYPCLHSPKDHKGNKINTPYPEDVKTPY
ncbi:retrovirus-related pol polyprotein from transposon TNT 1-94 [Tanacetum coccineum]